MSAGVCAGYGLISNGTIKGRLKELKAAGVGGWRHEVRFSATAWQGFVSSVRSHLQQNMTLFPHPLALESGLEGLP